MNQHFERIVALNPDSSFDKDYVKIPIKIRDVRKGREVDLGQIHYSIIIYYFMKSRIFLENSENLPDTSSSKAMQILTGFDSENMRKQLGKLDFSKGDLNVVKEKLEKVNQLIVKELDKK